MFTDVHGCFWMFLHDFWMFLDVSWCFWMFSGRYLEKSIPMDPVILSERVTPQIKVQSYVLKAGHIKNNQLATGVQHHLIPSSSENSEQLLELGGSQGGSTARERPGIGWRSAVWTRWGLSPDDPSPAEIAGDGKVSVNFKSKGEWTGIYVSVEQAVVEISYDILRFDIY